MRPRKAFLRAHAGLRDNLNVTAPLTATASSPPLPAGSSAALGGPVKLLSSAHLPDAPAAIGRSPLREEIEDDSRSKSASCSAYRPCPRSRERERIRGTVTGWKVDQAFGFIKPDGCRDDIFCLGKRAGVGRRGLVVGTVVEFETAPNSKARDGYSAVNVTIVERLLGHETKDCGETLHATNKTGAATSTRPRPRAYPDT